MEDCDSSGNCGWCGKPEFNPMCKCKDCTGEGLGWIKHLTKRQSDARFRREEKERTRRIQLEHTIGGV